MRDLRAAHSAELTSLREDGVRRAEEAAAVRDAEVRLLVVRLSKEKRKRSLPVGDCCVGTRPKARLRQRDDKLMAHHGQTLRLVLVSSPMMPNPSLRLSFAHNP